VNPQDRYHSMLLDRRAGRLIPAAEILRIVEVAGKTAADVLLDFAAMFELAGPAPGDVCELCGGRLRVRTSRPVDNGRSVVQRLECPDCKARPPGKRILPADRVRRRKKQKV